MKERTFRYEGKLIKLRLSNRVHENLVRRFTVTLQFKKKGRHNIKCLPCADAAETCSTCVFKDFDTSLGCVYLVMHVLKVPHSCIALHENYIEVNNPCALSYSAAHKKCITQMNKLRRCLEGFREIKKDE